MKNCAGPLRLRRPRGLRTLPAIGALLPLLLFARPVSAQEPQDFSKIEVQTQKVGGNLYMLTGAGGDIAVCVTNDGIMMVNSSFSQMSDKVGAAVKMLSDKPVRLVVDMHWHPGDTGGNAYFEKQGAVIAAHENTRAIMISGTMRDGVKYDPFAKEAVPTFTYTDHATFYWNGEEIRLIHYPHADTDGGTVVYFATSHVLHSGDSYRTDGFPIVDWEHGGSVKAVIAALEDMVTTYPPDTRVIPGHGPHPMTVADIRPYIEMLRDARGRVEKAFRDGQTLEHMKKEKILSGYENYSHHVSFDHFTEVLYREVSEKKE
jgi:glyoxylase-like metal-dependent hydrolase (beta-lactamase superfamily II)